MIERDAVDTTPMPAPDTEAGRTKILAGVVLILPLVLIYPLQLMVFIRGPQDLRVLVCAVELLFVGVVLFSMGLPKEVSLRPSYIQWLFLGWLLWALVAVSLSTHPVPSLARQAEWLCHILFATTLWFYLRQYAPAIKWVLMMVPLGFYLASLMLINFWISHPNPSGHDWFTGTPVFGHIRYVGYYALAGFIYSMGVLLPQGKPLSWVDRMLGLVLLAFCGAFLFWTGGRAALGSALISIAVVLWFAGKAQRGWIAVLTGLGLGLGSWLSTLFRVDDDRMGFFQSVERTVASSSLNTLSTGRLAMWRETVEAIRAHPWFGLGPEGYLYLETKTYGLQPHNLVLQFLVEWGVLGAVLFGALLSVVFWRAYTRVRDEQSPSLKSARMVAVALMVGFTVHSLVDGLYYHAVPLMILFTSIAIALLPTPKDVVAVGWDHRVVLRGLQVVMILLSVFFATYYALYFG